MRLENKSQGIFKNVIQAYPEYFDEEKFSAQNIEWALNIVESRVLYANFQSFLLPMLDSVSFESQDEFFNPEINNETRVVKVLSDKAFKKNDKISLLMNLRNERYLLYYGRIVENYKYDCFTFSLSFSSKKEDSLAQRRVSFYQKYFLFDSNEVDLIEECVNPDEPFSRRVLFYFYTLMMDEFDLKQTDPKRVGLEQDRIILEFSINQLRSTLSLIDNSHELAQKIKGESNYIKNNAYKYKFTQINLLKRIINAFEDNYMMLLKEDSL